MNKTILSIDLGTQMGWACWNNNIIVSGSISFKNDRFSGGGMRYLRFKKWLNELQSTDPITEVYFEEVRRHIGTDAAHAYGGFLATLTSWCEENKIPYQGIPVGTIKKHATNKGNANKQAMIDAVKAKGYNPIDDNEADAIALLHCILNK